MADRNGMDLDEASISRALEDAASRAKAAKAHLEEARRLERAATEEVELLARLLALRQGDKAASSRAEDDLSLVADGIRLVAATLPVRKPHEVVEATVDTLRETEHPLHISELMRELGERAVPLPGAGAQANVISHISRDKRIVRVARGIYGLAEWNMAPAAPARQRPSGAGGDETSRRVGESGGGER